ncbi:MAG TPA: TetR/AcrR family transcriptional regulator [Acidimicrobiales bacterium]|jgi:AcrR family transcriptional regulator
MAQASAKRAPQTLSDDDANGELVDEDAAGAVLRRAPFSDNPRVGVRGLRSQQRILDAALQVFGEVGYHQCGVIRITEVAGCSRASFYQYFSSKEDVFRELAGDVARQLMTSTDALDPIGPDAAGWKSLRAWVDRHAAIYSANEPVFQAFQAAAASDEAIASGSARIAARQVRAIRAKLSGTALPPRHLDAVLDLALSGVTRSHRFCDVLGAAVPGATLPTGRVYDALTDVIHRTLFGLVDGVNVRKAPARRLGHVRSRTALLESLQSGGAPSDLSPTGQRTLETLLVAAHEVLVTRGYFGTRVDDITAAAGVSHGAFYRYFENKDHVIRVLALRAMQRVATAFDEIPDLAGQSAPQRSTSLRRWLRRYASTAASEAAMIRVWVDATIDDPLQGLESAAAVDWGRSRLVRVLQPRGFGDVDTEALLLVVLLDALGAHRRSPEVIEAAALVIERGLLGFPD